MKSRAMKRKSRPRSTNVFVYGTLMRGEARHGILRECGVEMVLLADAPGLLVDLGDYPALVPGANGDYVRGELVRCRHHEELFRRLDEIEGFRGEGCKDNLFERKLTPVGMMDGHVREGWVYAYARPVSAALLVPSGDWRERRGTRRAFLKALVRGHCGGDERAVARELVRWYPIPPEPEEFEKAVNDILPLWAALERGDISERRLAMVSGQWAVEVEAVAQG